MSSIRRTELPGELSSCTVPGRLVVALAGFSQRRFERFHAPLAGQEPRDRIEAVTLGAGDSPGRDAGTGRSGVEQASRLFGDLWSQVEAVGHREGGRQSMMDIERRVVVGSDRTRDLGLIEAQVGGPCVGPPGVERDLMKIASVAVVVEPQTEARAAQSEWPDLRVLAVATLGPLLPLRAEIRDCSQAFRSMQHVQYRPAVITAG